MRAERSRKALPPYRYPDHTCYGRVSGRNKTRAIARNRNKLRQTVDVVKCRRSKEIVELFSTFEISLPRTPSECATGLRYAPTLLVR